MNRFLMILAFGLTACGGVSDGTVLGELDADDRISLCEEAEDDYSTETITCPDFEFTPPAFDAAACATGFTFPADCAATVGDLRDCNDALDAQDPCDVEATSPAACSWQEACFGGGDDTDM